MAARDRARVLIAEALSRCATSRGYRLRDERGALADAVLALFEVAEEWTVVASGIVYPYERSRDVALRAAASMKDATAQCQLVLRTAPQPAREDTQ